MSEVVPMKRVIVVLVVLGLATCGGLWWQLSGSSDDAAKPAPSVTTSPPPAAGRTTVPALVFGPDSPETRATISKRLERAGLKVTFAKLSAIQGKAQGYSTPAPGTVVPVGSTVVVALN